MAEGLGEPRDPGVPVSRFSWDYASRNEKIRRLQERAVAGQWQLSAVNWTSMLEFGTPLVPEEGAGRALPRPVDAPVPPDRWNEFRWEYHTWLTSQFLHGEQGALLTAARLVEVTPDLDQKLFAAMQVADEARHVEAYASYLQRLGPQRAYPVNAELHTMLSQLVTESRWDMVFLGMQLIVEGIALALFRLGHISSFDPVVKQVTELVARDEARHVTFGVVVLEELYKELTHAELADREEFVRESIELMSRRFLLTEVWERMELDPAAGKEFAANNALLADIRRLMFARVSTGLARVGVLTPSVREHLMAV